jgi:hypothetical protein
LLYIYRLAHIFQVGRSILDDDFAADDSDSEMDSNSVIDVDAEISDLADKEENGDMEVVDSDIEVISYSKGEASESDEGEDAKRF